MINDEIVSNESSSLNISDGLKRAKHKLFYFSAVLIFVIIFEPSMTGFLGNFSIKIHSNPSLFIVAIYAVWLWLFLKFLLTITHDYPAINFVNSPKKSWKSLSFIWEKHAQKVTSIEQEIKSLSVNLEAKNINEGYEEFLEENCKDETQIGLENLCSDIRRLIILKNEFPDYKERLINIKRLIFMDILFPGLIAILALFTLIFGTFNSPALVDKISVANEIQIE